MKKIITLLFVVSLAFGLVGCSSTSHTGYNGLGFDYPKNWIVTKDYEDGKYYKSWVAKSKKNSSTEKDAYNVRLYISPYGDSEMASTFYTFATQIRGNLTKVESNDNNIQVYKGFNNGGNIGSYLVVKGYNTPSCEAWYFDFSYNGIETSDIEKLIDSIDIK